MLAAHLAHNWAGEVFTSNETVAQDSLGFFFVLCFTVCSYVVRNTFVWIDSPSSPVRMWGSQFDEVDPFAPQTRGLRMCRI